jgi:protein arginine kinase activator
MLCDACGKKEATVHLTEIVNEKITKLHLCEACAKNKGAEMEEHFGLSDLLAGLADLGAHVEPEAMAMIKCSSCGFTYQDFKKVGRFGCSECYETFKKQLDPLLKRIHGSNRHVGKVPLTADRTVKETTVQQSIKELKVQLEKAVQAEEFEKAAKLRDRLRELEGNSKAGGAGQ